jgi:hypothetical protein
MPKRNRDSRGRFSGNGFFDAVRERPGASAAVVAGAAGIAAAGAFLWTRRGQIGEVFNNGLDRLSEKAERMGSGQSQSEIAEEALTLKETGKKSKGPRGPLAQQDIKAGMATVE